MRPNPIPTPADGETDMFRNRLDNMIDMRHELVRLAGLIDWKRFDEAPIPTRTCMTSLASSKQTTTVVKSSPRPRDSAKRLETSVCVGIARPRRQNALL